MLLRCPRCRCFPVREKYRGWLQHMVFAKLWNQVEAEGVMGKVGGEKPDYHPYAPVVPEL